MKPAIATCLAVGLSALLSGCASSGPPLPPSLQLPAPVSDLRALRKGDRVYLAWTAPTQTSDHENIRHQGPTLICRSMNVLTACSAGVGEVQPSSAAVSSKNPPASLTVTYIDQIPVGAAPGDELVYAVEALNPERRGAGLSNQVREPAAAALPPPKEFGAEITAAGVRFHWSCEPVAPPAGEQYRLRIYQRLQGGGTDNKIAEPDLGSCAGPALFDQTFQWEKTYEYRAAAVKVISQEGKPDIEIEGDDTPTATVFAHDIFPPSQPAGLLAAFSGAGQAPFIDLIWSPNGDADLAGYNVYRREGNGAMVKVNADLVKAPAYRDAEVAPGRKYFYAVTAVDVRGNESAKSEEAGESVP